MARSLSLPAVGEDSVRAVRSGQILMRIPAGRWGMPDDLRGAVVTLSSEASDYLHGTTLSVDGGWMGR
jgi:2-deoxy-D-gluconate 3-dehydrogenase